MDKLNFSIFTVYMAEENYLNTILSNKFLKGLLFVALVAIIFFIVVLMGIVIFKTINNQYVKIGTIEFNLPLDSNRNEKNHLEIKKYITPANPSIETKPQTNTSSNNFKSPSVTVTGNITGKNVVAGINNGNVGDQTYINTFQRRLNDSAQNDLLQCLEFYLAIYNKTPQNYLITISYRVQPDDETQTFVQDIYNFLISKGYKVRVINRTITIVQKPIGWRFDFCKDGVEIAMYSYSNKIKKPCTCGGWGAWDEEGQ